MSLDVPLTPSELEDQARDAIVHPNDITLQNMHLIRPTSKFDTSRVELLSSIPPDIWMPIIPDLLNWTLDPGWPTTFAIFELLISNPITIEACIPFVTAILDQVDPRDDEHQNVLLNGFVGEIGLEYQVQMLDCLKRFLRNVTDTLEEDYEWREMLTEMIGDIEDGMASPKARREF